MDCKKIIVNIFTLVLSVALSNGLSSDDENFFGIQSDRFNWRSHPCHRVCNPNEPPKTCYYVFVVETYSTMSKACYDCPRNITDCNRLHCISADGFQKMIYTVNRQIPGPTIEVCRNDKIVVDVRNRMLSESTTIHWHGMSQFGSPYSDGVPFITQCPIPPGLSFRYKFNANIDGTYFWHSHSGNQRANGLFGALIVHPVSANVVHQKLYDYDDQVMIINDWSHVIEEATYTKFHHFTNHVNPETILVNGLGRVRNFQKNESSKTPLAVFKVIKGKKNRVRVIQAASQGCPIQISISNHSMLVISLDGNDIEPYEVDAVTIWPGERVDFILEANQQPDNYWIMYRGYGQCQKLNSSSNRRDILDGNFQVAILSYDTVPLKEPQSPVGWALTTLSRTSKALNFDGTGSDFPASKSVEFSQLRSMAANDISTSGQVDHQIYISFDAYKINNFDYHREGLYGYNQTEVKVGTPQLNHISLKLPPFPLLSQPEMIKPSSFCNSSTIPSSCLTEHCSCTHVIQVKLNCIVELVLIYEGQNGAFTHPFHLHGQSFRVLTSVGLDEPVTSEMVKQWDREGKIARKLDHAPIKDTLKVLNPGFSIIRFHAKNPGYWLFHCHFEEHSNVGMALVFKVGEHEDFPPKPKNFLTCGNFQPDF